MEYKIIEKDNINYITVPALTEAGLINMFTLNKLDFKFDPDVQFEELSVINHNMNIVTKELGINPRKLFTAKQSHTNKVRVVGRDFDYDDMPFGGKYWDVDGMLTKEKDVILITRYADCTPIILYDKRLMVQANMHSGWRGTLQKISLEGLREMTDYYKSSPEDIIALIGPSIGKDDFEVTVEVYELFSDGFPEYSDTIKRKDESHWLIDTREINKRLLLESGIKAENIISIDISTVTDMRFHSYRRDKGEHGLMSFITMIR